MFPTKLQYVSRQKHLDAAIRPTSHQLVGSRYGQCFEHFATSFVIDRPSVVRVHQSSMPNRSAFINVSDGRQRQLEQRLGERICGATMRDFMGNSMESWKQNMLLRGFLPIAQEIAHGRVPCFVRLDPA